MIKASDFVYDGKSSMSEMLKISTIDGWDDNNDFTEKTYNLFKSGKSSKWNIAGIDYENPMEFPIKITFQNDEEDEYYKRNPIIAQNRLSQITHWLFNQTGFKRLQIMNDELRDMYFMAVFKDAKTIKNGTEIIGFEATVMCDSIGAYITKTIHKAVSVSSSFSLQCLQDGLSEITPKFILKPTLANLNIVINGETMSFDNVTPESTITIDTETLIATSSAGDNLFANDLFNKKYPYLRNGNNNIVISGACDFTMEYTVLREVSI